MLKRDALEPEGTAITASLLILMIILAIGLLASPLPTGAQPVAKTYRIGVLATFTREDAVQPLKALDEGLRELGHIEGRDILFERRFAEARYERLPDLAAELVRLEVDVILASSNPAIDAARKATTRIPIVMANGFDPVTAGFVRSLARPSGNITGSTLDAGPEISGKRLQLLKEISPKLSRVGVLVLRGPPQPGQAQFLKLFEDAARSLGVTLQFVEYRGPDDFEAAFATMVRHQVHGFMGAAGPVAFARRSQIVDLAARHRLPSVYELREYVETGGLMSYGPSLVDNCRRAGIYIDKILKGAKPGDLPVHQPTKFELVINLRTAKALGLTIPQSVLVRADEVITK